MSLDCLCAGILVADHLCSTISHLPKAGELVLADDLPLAIGGCAANAAIDLARLGVNVDVVGCVGDDPFGQFIADTLRDHGARASGLRRLADRPTSGTLIINVKGEDRRFIHNIGANGGFQASDIKPELVRQAKVLYIGGYLLMPALRPDELASVFRDARAADVKTVLDIVVPGPGDHLAALAPVLAHTDVFLPNSDEAREITGTASPIRQAETFRECGAGTVVITCGDAGTILLGDNLRLRAEAYNTPFVGGTGAGDAFDAGYIAGLLGGESPQRCLEWGSALGASCVRAVGATESVFNRAEAEAFMRENRLRIEPL